MIEFNEEAARRGDPIEWKDDFGLWNDGHFVGRAINGGLIVEKVNLGIRRVENSSIRMKEKALRSAWVQCYRMHRKMAIECTMAMGSHDLAKEAAKSLILVGELVGDPQEIFIPEE